MNDNLLSGPDKTAHILRPSKPTNFIDITTADKAADNFAASSTKPSPSHIPNNETQSCILESGALMCASSGTIPFSARPESQNLGQNDSNMQNTSNNSIINSKSKYRIFITTSFTHFDVVKNI